MFALLLSLEGEVCVPRELSKSSRSSSEIHKIIAKRINLVEVWLNLPVSSGTSAVMLETLLITSFQNCRM